MCINNLTTPPVSLKRQIQLVQTEISSKERRIKNGASLMAIYLEQDVFELKCVLCSLLELQKLKNLLKSESADNKLVAQDFKNILNSDLTIGIFG